MYAFGGRPPTRNIGGALWYILAGGGFLCAICFGGGGFFTTCTRDKRQETMSRCCEIVQQSMLAMDGTACWASW